MMRCSANCGANRWVSLQPGRYNVQVSLFTERWEWVCNKRRDFEIRADLTPGNIGKSRNSTPTNLISSQTTNSLEQGVAIYPNPATSTLFISATELAGQKGQITIISPYGQMMRQSDLEQVEGGQLEVDLSAYPTGLYLINTKLDSGESFNQKVIISK